MTDSKFTRDSTINNITESVESTDNFLHYYKNDHKNIGVALIFNQRNIKDKEIISIPDYRPATKNFVLTLKSYGFDVRMYEDLEYSAIESVLRRVAKVDHSNNDCILITILTLGTQNNLYAFDTMYPIDKIWEPFLNGNCKTLENKPKIFIIQASPCKKVDTGVICEDKGSTSIQIAENITDIPIKYVLPSSPDLFLFYSTFSTFYTSKNSKNESWLIQSITNTLKKNLNNLNKDLDLYHLVSAVNNVIKSNFNFCGIEHLNEGIVMPILISTFTKQFVIKPRTTH
ncbi:caspase-like [Condylostylus longicornis]|uniref:caspase-like n=1 Tax=Condylostylus longicornis TaxID=2530218 RepID=UPI00244DE9FA|nr:caspase-like [Condylostylus longicornis]